MLLCLFLGIVSPLLLLEAQEYEVRVYENEAGAQLPYRVLFPDNYDQSKSYPLILFLHGSGERGDDNEKQLVHGAKRFLDKEERKKYPAIVVFPQCPLGTFWSHAHRTGEDRNKWVAPFYAQPNQPMKLVIELLDQMVEQEAVDTTRLYLGGLSIGGFGTFDLLAHQPNRFAAAFPICGGGNPNLAPLYASNTALWVFHGAKDDVVLPKYSRSMVAAIKAAGGAIKYTEYPEANHNSWDAAFAEPDLLAWLFQHQKN